MPGDEEHKTSSPQLFTNMFDKWLDNALDYGLSEAEFWDMTIAELERVFRSKQRLQKEEAKQRANYDYILADLIGRSISRVYSASAKMPSIEECYPSLFDEKQIQEEKQQKQIELSAIRFKNFADSFNRKFKKGEKNK